MRVGSGDRVDFVATQPRPIGENAFTDTLDLKVFDGERLHWQIPVTQSFDDFGNALRRSTLRDRRLERPGRAADTFHFVLNGKGTQFTTWKLTGSGNVRGLFTLDPDFSGRGRALKGRQLEFVGAWNRQAHATILLADGPSAAVAGPGWPERRTSASRVPGPRPRERADAGALILANSVPWWKRFLSNLFHHKVFLGVVGEVTQ